MDPSFTSLAAYSVKISRGPQLQKRVSVFGAGRFLDLDLQVAGLSLAGRATIRGAFRPVPFRRGFGQAVDRGIGVC